MIVMFDIPKSTKYWFIIQCFFIMILIKLMNKYKYIKNRILGYNIPITLIAQYALAFAHVICNLFFGIIYTYRDWLGIYNDIQTTYIRDIIIGMPIAYFMVDSILIILIDFKVQYLYLIHHAISIYMSLMLYHKIVQFNATINYMFTIEFSNIAISLWDLVKRARKLQQLKLEEPILLNRIQNILTPILMATYVPARSLILTYTTIVLLYTINTSNIYLNASIWISTILILYMSYKFVFKIFGIGYKNIIQNSPGLFSFTSMTYILKLYVSLGWFILILPTSSRYAAIPLGFMVLFIDFVNIIISLIYSSTYYPGILISSLDYISICIKIVLNGIYIYARTYVDYNKSTNYNLWSYLIYANIGMLLFSIYNSRNIYKAFETRNPMPYLLHYFISAIVPVFLMPFGTAPYTAIISYFIGGYIWTLYPRSKYSVGFMHIFMIIADIALLSWGN